MATEVTDPALLEELERGDAPSEVSDPAVVGALENVSPPVQKGESESALKKIGRYGYGQAEAGASLGLQALAYLPAAGAAAGQWARTRFAPWDDSRKKLERMIPPVGHPASRYKTEEEREAAIDEMLKQQANTDASETRALVTRLIAPPPQTEAGREVAGRVAESAPIKGVQWVGDRSGDAAAWVNEQLGGSEADQETVRNVFSEAVPAMAGPVIGKGLGSAGAKLKPWLKDKAERAAIRSMDVDRAAVKRVFGRPLKQEAVNETGRWMLDENIPLRSPVAAKEALADILATEGPEIGLAVESATKAGAVVDWRTVAQKVLASDNFKMLASNTEMRPAARKVIRFLKDQSSQHPEGMDPASALRVRQALDKLSNWQKDAKAVDRSATDSFREIRGILNEQIDQSMEKAGLGDQWRRANRTYRNAIRAEQLADIGVEKGIGNKFGTPSEKAFGGAGLTAALATGNPLPLLGSAGYIALKRFGMPTSARLADALSKSLPAGSPALSQNLAGLSAYLSALKERAAAQGGAIQWPLGLAPAGAQEEKKKR